VQGITQANLADNLWFRGSTFKSHLKASLLGAGGPLVGHLNTLYNLKRLSGAQEPILYDFISLLMQIPVFAGKLLRVCYI